MLVEKPVQRILGFAGFFGFFGFMIQWLRYFHLPMDELVQKLQELKDAVNTGKDSL